MAPSVVMAPLGPGPEPGPLANTPSRGLSNIEAPTATCLFEDDVADCTACGRARFDVEGDNLLLLLGRFLRRVPALHRLQKPLRTASLPQSSVMHRVPPPQSTHFPPRRASLLQSTLEQRLPPPCRPQCPPFNDSFLHPARSHFRPPPHLPHRFGIPPESDSFSHPWVMHRAPPPHFPQRPPLRAPFVQPCELHRRVQVLRRPGTVVLVLVWALAAAAWPPSLAPT